MKISKSSLASAFILAAGIVLMFIGIRNGELEAILRKAIFICLECIGIG